MKLTEIKKIADKYVELLRPYCDKISVAGSIRREKPDCRDIEIVCCVNLAFCQEFVDTVRKWEKVKGEPIGAYTQRLLPEGIKLDLFIATKDNWGLQLAIRTGSAEFSHKVLANGWCKKGYRSEGGILYKDGKPTYIREEKELFKLLGIEYIEPQNRHWGKEGGGNGSISLCLYQTL